MMPPAARLSIVTFPPASSPLRYFREGDRIRISPAPNALRHFVRSINSETDATIEEIRRPSRGYAKHVRRLKAAAK